MPQPVAPSQRLLLPSYHLGARGGVATPESRLPGSPTVQALSLVLALALVGTTVVTWWASPVEAPLDPDPPVRSADAERVRTADTHQTAPSHPENFTAVPGPGAGEITLDWDPPHDDAGSPIDHYEVYRDGRWIANTTTTGYVDTGLGDGESHHYSVAAVNEAGQAGEPCGIEWATTYDLPTAPRNLTAEAAPGRISLSWAPPADDGGANVTSYHVYADQTRIATVDGTRHVDDGLEAGETLTYRVSAENIVGEGPRSNATSATTPDVPSAPRRLSATTGPDVGEVTLDWQPPADDGGEPVTGYRVYRDGQQVAGTASTGYVDTGLDDGTLYTYRVSAVNVIGEGAESPSAHAETFDTPSRVWWIVAVAGPERGQITVQWAEPRDTGGQPVDHYRVYRDGVLHANVTDRKLVDDDLGDGVRHAYRVAAVNDVGEARLSERAAATTWALPGAPQDLRAQAAPPPSGEASKPVAVDLDWNPPEQDGGREISAYRIYRGTTPEELSLLAAVDGGTTRYVDERLDPTSNYFYRVEALNALGPGPASEGACSGPFPWVAPLDAATGRNCHDREPV